MLLAACAGTSSPAAGTAKAKAVKGGTATYALANGEQFTWMLPLPNQANWEPWDQNTEYSMWRPLYMGGVGSKPVVNEAQSLAYPPVWSNNNTTVTITLKPRKWSNGQPVTTRDVQFFFNLYKANKSKIATYIQGNFPDNVKSIAYVSAAKFVMNLTHPVSRLWFDNNQLTAIVPLPQKAWDLTSANGPVGNYDLTTAGAKKVFAFLYAQSKKLSTYATNPLWKTVDGPWVVTGYSPTTARTVLTANAAYSGPTKPRLHSMVIESYPSNTSEVDALRSGSLDYGWLPYSDYGLIGYFKSHGYTVKPWAPDYVQWAELGYTSPTYGPLVRQLYIRQALQHLVNQPLILKAAYHGLGQYTYGPVPNIAGSPYVSPQEKVDPYPYSTSKARSLLAAHGWKMGPAGVMTCASPGTGPSQCGAGIASGRALDLLFMYQTGVPTVAAEAQSFQTAAKAAGVGVQLDPQTQTTMYSIGGVCPPGPCNWGIILYSNWLWNYGNPGIFPTGGQQWGSGNYWGGGYQSAKATQLIALTHSSSSINALHNYQNYISRQVAGLWFPTGDNQISVVKNTLHG
ncbi:MAG: ABC transporter substrate-binding protein, partial [Acidimicrobiales bacterium]